MQLSQITYITEKRNFGTETVNQSIETTINYNPDEDTFEVVSCYITHDDEFAGTRLEVSKLLDKAEGNPLNAILEAINWQEIYSDATEQEEFYKYKSSPMTGAIQAAMKTDWNGDKYIDD